MTLTQMRGPTQACRGESNEFSLPVGRLGDDRISPGQFHCDNDSNARRRAFVSSHAARREASSVHRDTLACRAGHVQMSVVHRVPCDGLTDN